MADEARLVSNDDSTTNIEPIGLQRLNQLLAALQTAQCRSDEDDAWTALQNGDVMATLVDAWRRSPDRASALLAVVESMPRQSRRSRSLRSTLKRAAVDAGRAATERAIDELEENLGGPISLAVSLGPDAPPPRMVPADVLASLTTPRGYAVEPGGVFKLRAGPDGDLIRTQVCAAPIFICGRAFDVVTYEAKRQVIWKGNGGWHSRTVSRRTIMDNGRIVALSDFEAPVSSAVSTMVIAYLTDFEATNGHRIPAIQTSSSMGWQPDGGFLLPDVYYMVESRGDYRLVPPTGLEAVAGGWSMHGKEDKWFELVEALREFPIAMLAIYASLAAPLVGYLDIPGFIVDISGETSGGKTTVLRLAASVWGRPSDAYPSAMYSWDSTQVWIERTAGFLHSLPLILDETKRARHPRVVRDIIYTFCHGQGRGRGSLDGTRHTPSWQSVLISSGEGMATSFSEDAGTRARVVSLTGKPLGADAAVGAPLADLIRGTVTESYGHFGRKFVHYLVANRNRREDILSAFNTLKERYSSAAFTAVGRRHASHLAAMSVAALIAEQIGLPKPKCDPFSFLLESQAKASADADRPLAALQDVIGWCAAHQTRFYGRHDHNSAGNVSVPSRGWAGAWSEKPDWEAISILSTELRGLLQSWQHDPDEVVSRWLDRGWLERGNGRNRTHPTRIGEATARCYRIRREAVDLIMLG